MSLGAEVPKMDKPKELPPFQKVWEEAVQDYTKKVEEASSRRGQPIKPDLYNPKWKEVKTPQDLLQVLKFQDEDFEKETEKGAFSEALKGAFGPVNLLMNMFGGAAGMAFPPSSQILGAVSVLIQAGKDTAGAFDALGDLFRKISGFASRLQSLTTPPMPPELEQIVRGLLISMLNICALATTRTYHVAGEVKKHRFSFKKGEATVTMYFKQLLFGKDSGINDEVNNLNFLVEEEGRMCTALNYNKTCKIETITLDIQGLTIQTSKVTYELQADSAEVKFRLAVLQEGQERIEDATVEIKGAAGEIKAAMKGRQAAEQDFLTRLDERLEKIGGPSASKQSSAMASKSGITKVMQQSTALRKSLSPLEQNGRSFQKASQRLPGTADWITTYPLVCDWMNGKTPLLWVFGSSGTGKTVLAARIVEALGARSTQSGDCSSQASVAYLFCEGRPDKIDDINAIVRTIAYQLAEDDSEYARYVLDKFTDADGILSKTSSGEILVAEANNGLQNATEVRDVLMDGTISATPVAQDSETEQDGTIDTNTSGSPIPNGSGQKMPTQDQRLWNALFQKYFRDNSKEAFIVIDAIDQLSKDALLELLDAIQSSVLPISDLNTGEQAPVHMRFLIFASKEQIEDFKEKEYPSMEGRPQVVIDALINKRDLEAFIVSRLNEAWSHSLITKDLATKVREAVLKAANGNFLLASLVIDEIAVIKREDGILKMLDDLPPDLNSAMLLALRRMDRELGRMDYELDPTEIEDLNDMLAWVACTSRDLSIAELDALLAVRKPFGARIIDLEDRLRDTFKTLFLVSGEESTFETLAKSQARQRQISDDQDDMEDMFLLDTKAQDPPTPINPPHTDDSSLNAESPCSDPLEDKLSKAKELLRSTTVTLGHSLLASYIQAKKVEQGLVNFTTDRMQAKVLIGCLKVLCDAEPSHDKDMLKTAIGYCGSNLGHHFEDPLNDDCDLKTREEVGLLLIRLLRSESLVDRWVSNSTPEMTSDLLSNDDLPKLMLAWLNNENVLKRLDDDEKRWVSTANEQPLQTLFSRVALSHARRWLTQRSRNADSNFWFLNTHLAKAAIKPINLEKSAAETDYTWYDSKPGRVVEVASWALSQCGLPETSFSLSRVGYALRETSHYPEALEQYHTAISIEDKDPLVRAGLAETYSMQENWTKAIEHMEASIELYRTAFHEGLSTGDPDWTLETSFIQDLGSLGDYYVAAQRTEDAPRSCDAVMSFVETVDSSKINWAEASFQLIVQLSVLNQMQKYSESIALIERILRHPQALQRPFKDMYTWIVKVDNVLLAAVRETKRFDICDRLHLFAWKMIRRFGSEFEACIVRYSRANSILRFHPEHQDKAIKLLRDVLNSDDSHMNSSDSYDMGMLIKSVKLTLARVYLDKVLHAREQDLWQDVGTNAQALMDLDQQDSSIAASDDWDVGSSKLVTAAWYVINGRIKPARKAARPNLKHGLDWLSDDDPGNDTGAWMMIANSLLMAGDESRAVAAVGMLRHMDRFGNEAAKQDTTTAETNIETGEEKREGGERQAAANAHALDGSVQNGDATEVGQSEAVLGAAEQVLHQPAAPETDTMTQAGGDPGNADSMSIEKPTAKDDADASWYYCDGACGKEIKDREDMWRCSYCLSDLCTNCRDLVIRKELKDWVVCGHLHRHVLMPGIIEKYPSGTIKVGNGYVPASEWLQELRTEWGIS